MQKRRKYFRQTLFFLTLQQSKLWLLVNLLLSGKPQGKKGRFFFIPLLLFSALTLCWIAAQHARQAQKCKKKRETGKITNFAHFQRNRLLLTGAPPIPSFSGYSRDADGRTDTPSSVLLSCYRSKLSKSAKRRKEERKEKRKRLDFWVSRGDFKCCRVGGTMVGDPKNFGHAHPQHFSSKWSHATMQISSPQDPIHTLKQGGEKERMEKLIGENLRDRAKKSPFFPFNEGEKRRK